MQYRRDPFWIKLIAVVIAFVFAAMFAKFLFGANDKIETVVIAEPSPSPAASIFGSLIPDADAPAKTPDAPAETPAPPTASPEPIPPYTFLSVLDWYNGSKPRGGLYAYDYAKDNYGAVYSNALGGADGYEQNFQAYKIDGKYARMTGTVTLNYDFRTQTNDGVHAWIYGDGILLYQSPEIRAGCSTYFFDLSLVGVKDLQMKIQGKNMVRLVDCVLYPDSSSEIFSSALPPI